MSSPISPSVSVCIPIFNGAEFLEATLRSVLSQEGVDLQLVVVDDQSTDGSWEIAQRILADSSDHHLVLCRNQSRLGMAGNWNRCMEKSDGVYIKVMGQDDLISSGCLKIQAEHLQSRPELAVVTSPRTLVSRTGRALFMNSAIRGSIESGNVIRRACLRQGHNIIGEPVGVMARRSEMVRLGGFDPRYHYYTDLEMWFRLISDRAILFMRESLCSFRVHRASCSWYQQSQAAREFTRLFEHYQNQVPHLSSFERMLQKTCLHSRALLRRAFYCIFG